MMNPRLQRFIVTTDAHERNALAIELAEAGDPDVALTILSMLGFETTKGARGTLIHALSLIPFNKLPPDTLEHLERVINDETETGESQWEAEILYNNLRLDGIKHRLKVAREVEQTLFDRGGCVPQQTKQMMDDLDWLIAKIEQITGDDDE
jgi:hypothetical protein